MNTIYTNKVDDQNTITIIQCDNGWLELYLNDVFQANCISWEEALREEEALLETIRGTATDTQQDYEFFKYSMLVSDLIISINDYFIPYDMMFDPILKSYNTYNDYYAQLSDEELNSITFDPYQHMVDYINNDEELYASLRDMNENN